MPVGTKPAVLADVKNFEEWLAIALEWKTRKQYRSVLPAKEFRVGGGKREKVGSDPPSSSSTPSTLDSSVSARCESIPSSSVDPSPTSTSGRQSPMSAPAPRVPIDSTSSATLDSTSRTVLPTTTDSSSTWLQPESTSSPEDIIPATFSWDTPPPSPPRGTVPRFESEYFEFCKSPKGGLGCFARKDIASGTIIHSEKALFQCTNIGVHYEYDKLTEQQKEYYMSLHGFAAVANHRVVAIYMTNRFHIPGSKEDGIFLNSSRFNHACPPHRTCTYKYDPTTREMAFTAAHDIKKGEEVTIAYSSDPNGLYDHYGFFCDCPGCPPVKEAYKMWKAENRLREDGHLHDYPEWEDNCRAWADENVWRDEDVYGW